MRADGEQSPLDYMPELDEEETEAWLAFVELSNSRETGGVPRRLRPTDVLAWMELRRVPDPARERLAGVLMKVDGEWHKRAVAKYEQEAEAATARAKRR